MLLAFKIKLALACAAGLAGPLALAPLAGGLHSAAEAGYPAPALVEIARGTMAYRESGDFTRKGQQSDAPLTTIRFDRPFAIMKTEVSATDYQACVDDRACRALDRDVAIAIDLPAVQVSWHDAVAYAAWLSRKTGDTYRLPTDTEWAYAAGSRFRDDGIAVDTQDPSRRWIERYEREQGASGGQQPQRFGSFGVNENGLADLAGNVWEWTSTCFTRNVRDDAGRTIKSYANCGVRIAEGAHRAYVSDFIRDARAGGCAAGTPPNNLGFRLVREQPSWTDRMASRLKATFRSS
ncbi:SUMF1/EgtB/PvdO family nonheme iron enzyme [Bradyrhizobium sp. SZCCHNPS2010]|uniref:SUMF1/EgtB/PvdO family nonheme iron enzyme n=1 Tax=Bradyrhizobium sp. SZCCHNPS2010 TaxID=3057333 RepID=UPI0029166CC1|nr:SUMF1/EgtB/PvdO family nonheme iron enzyme [Bradyrhizobium sp. SZCCHNPS2010]